MFDLKSLVAILKILVESRIRKERVEDHRSLPSLGRSRLEFRAARIGDFILLAFVNLVFVSFLETFKFGVQGLFQSILLQLVDYAQFSL